MPNKTPTALRRLLPVDRVADADLTAGEHLREGATAPVVVHRRPQTGNGFLHPLARLRFPGDLEARGTNTENPLSRVGERDAADHQVRASCRRWRGPARFAHERVPHLAL